MRILLVEDDILIARGLMQSLRHEGFVVNHVDSGKDALLTLMVPENDMVILDLGLPDMDGLSVLKTIRAKKNNIPILILTARASLDQKVVGLDLGADDYLAKPFELPELFARLRVLQRRLGTAQSALITLGDVTLDSAAHTVSYNNNPLNLAKKEYMVLRILMENAGRIQSREQIESKLYDLGEDVMSNAVEVHIHNLRKKLPENFIKTIRGIGYSVKQH